MRCGHIGLRGLFGITQNEGIHRLHRFRRPNPYVTLAAYAGPHSVTGPREQASTHLKCLATHARQIVVELKALGCRWSMRK
jgi:hypothetical protein